MAFWVVFLNMIINLIEKNKRLFNLVGVFKSNGLVEDGVIRGAVLVKEVVTGALELNGNS